MVDLAEIQAAYYMVAATGVLIAAVFYVLNLRISRRNQELSLWALEQSAQAQQQTLETRQAQMFLSIYNKITEKEFTRAWNTVMNSSWSSYQEFNELRKKPEFYEAFLFINGFFEGIGVLVKEGMLDIRWIALLIASWTTEYWEKIREAIIEHKKITGAKRLLSEYEYLYNKLMNYMEEHPELKT